MAERHIVRVLLVLGSLEGGGAERVALNLLRFCDPRQVDLCVGLLRREGDYLAQLEPGRIIGPAVRGRGLFDAIRAPFDVAAMIAESSPDVVMSFGLGPNLAVAAALIVSARPRPSWICREDSNPWAEIRNLDGGPAVQVAVRAALKWSWRRSDCLLTVSSDVAASLDGAAPCVCSLHNPIDVDAIEAAAVEPLVPAPTRPFMVAAGRLVRQKGFDRLIAAFACSRHARDLDLVILGEGPLRKALTEQARDLGVSLFLPGFQANPWAWFARARLFVLPSRWEGLPNMVAEAMACGAPVLACDCDFGPREQIAHGVSGWLTNPSEMAEAMDVLLTDPSLCERLAQAGRARAGAFAAPAIAESYVRLFSGRPSPANEPAPRSVGEAATAIA